MRELTEAARATTDSDPRSSYFTTRTDGTDEISMSEEFGVEQPRMDLPGVYDRT